MVRHAWMFRTAAIVMLLLGMGWLYTALLTDAPLRTAPLLAPFGALAVFTGIFLFRLSRVAIAVSALAGGIVGLSAAVFAPSARGPGILFLALVAIACIVYTVLAVRALTCGRHESVTRRFTYATSNPGAQSQARRGCG